MRHYQNKQSGFMLAPLLYMLALGGIGAAVMFSGYSQVLRSNSEMTAVNAVRQQLNTAAQTLSAASTLDGTSTILQPPAVLAYGSVTDTARLPTNYAAVNGTGSPTTYGVLDTASGVRQLDPWGKYYVYCRWNSAIATATLPSIMVISAGPDGSLSTRCGDGAAVGDDRVNKLSVAEAINRANVWSMSSNNTVASFGAGSAVQVTQAGAMTASSLTITASPAASGTISATGAITSASVAATGAITSTTLSTTGAITGASVAAVGTVSGATITSSGNISATGVLSGASLTLGTALTIGNGGTGATTAAGARTNLGATVTGAAVFTAATAAAARTALGSTATGDALFTAADATAARTTLGLGTMATQNANAVAITGGTISGVTFSGTISGGTYTGSVPFSSINAYPGGTNFLRQDGTWQPVALTGGSANYIPKWTSASALSTSSMYQNGSSIGINTVTTPYLLTVAGDIYANGGWLRTSGSYGLYFETYGGGWYMSDTTWIRSYNSKNVYVSAGFDTGGASGIACSGGLGGGYTFRVCGTQQVTSTLTASAGLNVTGRLNLTGPAGDWAQVINWGPGSVDGYGILVGTGASRYSQFQNGSGYYALLAYSSYGIYTNGHLYSGGDSYSANFYHNSDRRLKENIKPSAGLEIINKLKGVNFTWKKDGKKSAGVIAQDLQEVMPEAVVTKDDGFLAVNYDTMFAPVIESIKELKAMLDKLADKVAQLFTRVDAHDTEIKALREELRQLHGEFTSYKAAHP